MYSILDIVVIKRYRKSNYQSRVQRLTRRKSSASRSWGIL